MLVEPGFKISHSRLELVKLLLLLGNNREQGENGVLHEG